MSFKFNFFENESSESQLESGTSSKIENGVDIQDVRRAFKDNGIKWVIQRSAYINFITASVL